MQSLQTYGQLPANFKRKAINQQLSSRTIKNVVAAERIQEFPDQNAATALSRLPGISLMETDKVVIRGMEAKLNTILVNGITTADLFG